MEDSGSKLCYPGHVTLIIVRSPDLSFAVESGVPWPPKDCAEEPPQLLVARGSDRLTFLKPDR